MIIRCDQCETQFKLDDARVPEGGVRVRCSRCKHAFEVQREAAPASEPEVPLEIDDGQWEFSEEPLEPEPEPPSQRAAAGDVGVLTDPDAICVEPAQKPPPADSAGDTPELEPEESVGLDPESFFGDIGEEIAALGDEPGPAPRAAEPPPAAQREPAPEAERVAASPPEDAVATEPAAASDDLGNPETWAFVADPPPAPPDALAVEDDAPPSRAGADVAETADADEIAIGPTPVVPLPGRFGALWARASSSAAPLIGCLCALVMASIALPQLVRVEHAEPRVAGAIQVGEFVAERLSVRRIENRDGGTLLVVTGQLRNATQQERSLGRALRVRLHADAGPLDHTAWAGEAQGERALRETHIHALLGGAAERAGVLRARSIPAGSMVPFEAVFADPPAEARRAQLEVVSAAS